MSERAKRFVRHPSRRAVVVRLDDYRDSCDAEIAAIERMIEADEQVCAKALVSDWTNNLWRWRDPTAAFLVTLARAIDDALESDDYDGLRDRLETMRDSAEKEAERRAKK